MNKLVGLKVYTVMPAPLSESTEQLLDRFDDAWNGPAPPEIEDYLALGNTEERLSLLIELVRIDMERRLRAGQRLRLEEDYLPRFPDLSRDASAVAVLVQQEYQLRRRQEPDLLPAEYVQRFPYCRNDLLNELATLDTCGTGEPPQDATNLLQPAPRGVVLAAGEQIGGYELVQELGRGSMGVVYKARQTRLNRIVALKMILHTEHADAEQRQRFQGEAKAIARLRHPNIVQIYEIGEHRGQPFFVLEFVEGGTLAERALRQPLSANEVARLTATMARAIHAAHDAGIVHRDLKPANILLAADGTLKISDFGLAKHLDAQTLRTQSGAILGTPTYMAPEQASGQNKAIGPAADIYALGVILYEQLAGHPPFRGANQWDVMQRVIAEEPISLRRLAPKLPRDLETICHKCLRKAPADRYQSAWELAEDLERFLAGQPIQARPVPAWERGVKWARRHPAAAVSLAAFLFMVVTLLCALTSFSTYLQHALSERTQQLRAEQQARNEEARQRQEALHHDLQLNRYVADVQQAAQFWQLGEISQGYAFLTTRRWSEDDADPRSFAWHYLRRWCDHRPRLVQGHTAAVNCVRFHPDGSLLASCGNDHTIRLWDADTGTPRGLLSGHQGLITEMAFSVDGRRLVSAGHDGVRLWDVAERRQLAVLIERSGRIEHLELSPRGDLLAYLKDNGSEAQLWDCQSRRAVQSWPAGADPVLSLAFAPQGRSLALGYGDGRIKMKDVATGSELSCLLARHSVNALAFARRSPLLAAAGGDGLVTLWDVETRERIGELAGHTGTVKSLAFSPDERLLLSASEDGTVRGWDLVGQRLTAIFRAQNRPLCSVSFRPDGRVFAAGGADGLLSLWSATDAEKAGTPQLVGDPAGPMAFSPDGKWLAVAALDQTVRLHDAATRRLQRTLRGWHGEWQDVVFSPDGKYLAAACTDHRVHIWETSSGQPAVQLLGHQAAVTCTAYSSDGKWLASGGADHHVALWEMPAGQLRAALEAHKGSLTAVAFHPRGDLLATVGRDKIIKLWSLPDLHELHAVEPNDEVLGMIFTNEGKTLLVNGESKGVRCWNLTEKQELSAAESFPGRARSMAISPRARLLITADLGTIHAFDFATRKERFHLHVGSGGTRQVALSPDGSLLVFSSRGGSLRWWDLGRHHIRTTPEEVPHAVHSLAFSPRGDMLIAGSRARDGQTVRTPTLIAVYDQWTSNTVDDLVRFWSMPAGQAQQRLASVPTLAGQPCVAVSPDGRSLATGADDGTVGLWDLTTGQRRCHLFVSRHSRTYSPLLERVLALGAPICPHFDGDQMRAVTYSPDGRLLAAASEDGQVQLWQASTGKEWATLPGTHAELSCLTFSPDGKRLTVNNGNDIELWDISAEEGKPLLVRCLQGHTSTVRSLTFSPDGRLLASGAEDTTIRLWEVANGSEVKQLQGHIARVSSLAFHPDSTTLASAGLDGTVRLWHVPTGRELMILHRGASWVHTAVFSPDGTLLAAGGERPNGRGEIWFWQSTTGTRR